jgi:hypothetical protein
VLYHYTTTNSFASIIKTGKLWFSDLESTNDPRELHFGYDLIAKTISEYSRKHCTFEQQQIVSTWLLSVGEASGRAHKFCLCFSLSKDSLPMWKEYGDLSGLCIGFRPVATTIFPGRAQRVVYIGDAGLEGLESWVQAIADLMIEAGQYSHQAKDIVLMVRIMTFMTAIKHMSWRHEMEIRIVHSRTKLPPASGEKPLFSTVGFNRDGSLMRWSAPQPRKAGGEDKFYVEFPFGRRKRGKVIAVQSLK